MKILQALVSFIATVAVAVTIVGVGFLVCLLPPVTHTLSGAFSDDAVSPFEKSQLVQVADATRDYAFGSHDLRALYTAINEVDREYAEGLARAGKAPGDGFPLVVAHPETASVAVFEGACVGASERYCYPADVIAHLDDCNNIVHFAYPFIAVMAIVSVAGIVWSAHRGGRRRIGAMLRAGGVVALAAFAAVAIWAIVDFGGFFAAFHGIFFSEGGWIFSYDSLLICALPTAFWMGMGIVWLLVSVILSVLGIMVGGRLRRR